MQEPLPLGCGDLAKIRLDPGGPFARGMTKNATRAHWGRREIVVLQPFSLSRDGLQRFEEFAEVEGKWFRNISHEARYSMLKDNVARYYGTCAKKRGEQFIAVEGKLVRPSAGWPLPHRLDLALQLATFGLRLQQTGLVSCDWKLDQMAVTSSGVLRLVDIKNLHRIDFGRGTCSTDIDCCHCDHCRHHSGTQAHEQTCDLKSKRCQGSTFTSAAMIYQTAHMFYTHLFHAHNFSKPPDTPWFYKQLCPSAKDSRSHSSAAVLHSLLKGMTQPSQLARWNWTQVITTLHRVRASEQEAPGYNRTSAHLQFTQCIEASYQSTFAGGGSQEDCQVNRYC